MCLSLTVAFFVQFSSAQCTKDIECKGNRICVEGVCVEPKEESGPSESLPTPTNETTPPDGTPMGSGAFYMNLSGLFQFGPIFGFGIRVAPNLIIDAHWRYSSLGLLYVVLATDGFEDEMSMGCMAAGSGIRYFFPNEKKPHRLYVGGLFEYGWGKTQNLAEENWEWKSEDAQIIIAPNGGFRFRFDSNFFLNLGVLAGVAIDVKNEWWYLNNPSVTYDQRGATFFGMLEFTLGWEFGR